MSKPKVSPDAKLAEANSRLIYESKPNAKQRRQRAKAKLIVAEKPPTLYSMLRKIFKSDYLFDTEISNKTVKVVISKILPKYNEEIYTLSFALSDNKLKSVKMVNNYYRRYRKNHGTHSSMVFFLDSGNWKGMEVIGAKAR